MITAVSMSTSNKLFTLVDSGHVGVTSDMVYAPGTISKATAIRMAITQLQMAKVQSNLFLLHHGVTNEDIDRYQHLLNLP